jgi:hypothetical protein
LLNPLIRLRVTVNEPKWLESWAGVVQSALIALNAADRTFNYLSSVDFKQRRAERLVNPRAMLSLLCWRTFWITKGVIPPLTST